MSRQRHALRFPFGDSFTSPASRPESCNTSNDRLGQDGAYAPSVLLEGAPVNVSSLQLTKPFLAVQRATQYASESEDARTEQHNAAGLRNGRRAAPAAQCKRFRRNGAKGVFVGRGRSAVLIPVNRVTDRATRSEERRVGKEC